MLKNNPTLVKNMKHVKWNAIPPLKGPDPKGLIKDKKQGILRIDLKYGTRGEDVIRSIKRESKPSCRVYRGVEDIPRVLDGLGIAIVSTPSGVLSDRQCREKNVGGELLCTVH